MKNRYYFYVIYLIVISLAVVGVSFSSYTTTVEGSSQVTVARPVLTYTPNSLTYNGDPITEINGGINLKDVVPGDILVYKFDIKNYDGAKQNQVLLEYLITINFDPDELTLPLTYELLADDTYGTVGESSWVYLGFGEEITHSYTLTVEWDESAISPEYEEQEQSIQIQINSQQADSRS